MRWPKQESPAAIDHIGEEFPISRVMHKVVVSIQPDAHFSCSAKTKSITPDRISTH